VVWTLILVVALAAPGEILRAAGEASHVQPIRTAKERLGGKASDEQRVDNCNVPPDLRGPKPRPDECGEGASMEAKHLRTVPTKVRGHSMAGAANVRSVPRRRPLTRQA
jgi:hypothetical protein